MKYHGVCVYCGWPGRRYLGDGPVVCTVCLPLLERDPHYALPSTDELTSTRRSEARPPQKGDKP